MKNEKKLVEGFERLQRGLRRILTGDGDGVAKLESSVGEVRQLLAELGDDVAGSTHQLLAELESALDQVRVGDDDRDRYTERLNALEAELREVLYQKELLSRNFQAVSEENVTVAERSRKLEDTLRYTKEEIQKLREEVQKLKSPPLPYGTFLRVSEQEELVVISVDGKTYEVHIADEDIVVDDLKPGQTLLLNAALNVVGVRRWREVGEVAKIIESLGDGRFVVKARESEEKVVRAAETMVDVKVKAGDNVLYDPASEIFFELLPQSLVEEAVLEEVPEVEYDDIGGLDDKLEQIKDAIELPYIYGHLFKQFHLKPPKGILLYGPPGCGKTLIAKAVAHSLSLRIQSHLEENRDAIALYELFSEPEADVHALLRRYDALKSRVFQHREIYLRKMHDTDAVEQLYEQLNQSGILGDFIRRTEGQDEEPRLSCKIEDWLDLRMELREKGFGDLDPARVGDMLERKRKSYFLKRRQVSDQDYILKWLKDYLVNNSIDLTNLAAEKKRIDERIGDGVESYFLNIKGPELLNKYVGETEHRIREVFLRAREKASHGLPVIVFFDEMESMFRTRGSGISSDIESTIVPQFLTEIDGVEGLKNVIVIGASNRQDLIDPAVLRPGRLDIKIRIDRPDRVAAREIFSKYLTPDLPLDEEAVAERSGDRAAVVRDFIDGAVEEMYSTKEENRFLKVIYQSREEEILFFKDFSSGAMIEGIVSRAKTYALKRLILTGRRGLRRDDLFEAIRGEYKENEDLPNTTNPDDWSKISGRKGERIIAVESMLPDTKPKTHKEVEEVAVSSRYL